MKEKHKTCGVYDCPWPPNCSVRHNPNLGGYFVQDTTRRDQARWCWTHAQDAADRLNQGETPQPVAASGQMALF